MHPLKISLSMLLVTSACTRAESNPAPVPAPSAPAAKPVEAEVTAEATKPAGSLVVGPPVVTLAAGEVLAPVADDGSRNQRTWDVPGGPVELAAIQRGDRVVLRAFAADAAFDVTSPTAVGVDNAVVVVDDGTAVLLQQRSHLGPSPSTPEEILSRYTVTRIDWDATASKPIVGDTWSCEETDDDPCLAPAWADDTNPRSQPTMPKTDEARAAVWSWLKAIGTDDRAAVEAAMARGFRIYASTSHARRCDGFDFPVETKGTVQRTGAAACVTDALQEVAPKLLKRLTDKSVTTTAPSLDELGDEWITAGPNDVYVTVSTSSAYGDWTLVATVTRLDLETWITGAYLSQQLVDD